MVLMDLSQTMNLAILSKLNFFSEFYQHFFLASLHDTMNFLLSNYSSGSTKDRIYWIKHFIS